MKQSTQKYGHDMWKLIFYNGRIIIQKCLIDLQLEKKPKSDCHSYLCPLFKT